MPSQLNLPRVFTADDPAKLKTELERMTQELDAYLRALAASAQPVPALSTINRPFLAFGEMVRVSVPEGYTLTMVLPRPDIRNIGRRCGVRRDGQLGEVLVYAVGCLVGGYTRYRLANDVHFVEFLFDGDYYPSRAGGGT